VEIGQAGRRRYAGGRFWIRTCFRMLSVCFYSDNGSKNHSVSMSEVFYEWLAYSQFSKISQARSVTLELDEEQVSLPVVDLAEENRSRYLAFLSESIVVGTRAMLEHLEGQGGAVEDDKYRLGKLLEMLDLFKDQAYRYVRYY
jgi:hypothetical protein